MDPIVAGLIAGICTIIIFLVNLIKGAGILGILVKPLISGAIIFGIITGVQFLLTHFLDIKADVRDADDEKTTGENVDYTVADDIVDTKKYDESETVDGAAAEDSSSETKNDENTFVENNFNDVGSVDDYDSGTGMDNLGADTYPDENIVNTYNKSNYSETSREEKVSKALGFDATYEDMAKAIRTTLKRDK